MKLSVVIVNYNVEYFLEQCLYSVREAIKQCPDTEVFIVDNNSVDGSVKMLNEKFSDYNIICSKENLGFSKGNNLAIKQAKGDYILLLNPDTVVESDTFSKVVGFMDDNDDAGGLGVKMLDGKGKFLAESKRGLPTPTVAFYKIFGLSTLFKKSKKFGKYHLTYLDNNKTHKVDILSGAFMLMRKSVLDTIGYLDETFFMYGEDIDLSYRITQAGYNNYYFPETRIIHYKGESTKKSSINYVFVFYNAMKIFAKKHFSPNSAKMFAFLINLAIYLRAGFAIISRVINKLIVPFLDAVFIYGGFYFITSYWEKIVVFPDGGSYPQEFYYIFMPIYILVWLFAVYFSGGYDKPINLLKIIRGVLIGTVTILVAYALFPETFRFSRALIILGAVWGVLILVLFRYLLSITNKKRYKLSAELHKRYAVVADKEEANKITELIRKSNLNPGFFAFVSPENDYNTEEYTGNINQLMDIVNIYKIDEVIFGGESVRAATIIDLMAKLEAAELDFMIAPPETMFLIGSNSISKSSDLYITEINSIAKTSNKRNKRLIDISFSFFFILIYPILLFIVKKPLQFFANIFLVIFRKRTWVGYKEIKEEERLADLPKIPKGILSTSDISKGININSETARRLNYLYARNYKVSTDINFILSNLRKLGS